MIRTLLATFLLLLGATANAERPNIILIMADDLGWGDVGFNGNATIKTPHLDEMAEAGAKLNRFYAAAPVCSPTRGSCLTGRHPFRYGIYFANTGHMKPDELTLAELLKKHDYRTGHFGKWHLGTLTKTVKDANRGGPGGVKNFSPPQQNGFDVCFSTESKVPTWDPMLKPEKANKNSWNALRDGEGVPYNTRYWNHAGEEVKENLAGDDSRVIMDRAIPFIQESSAEKKPFFSVIWFHTPHLPVVAGPEHFAMYPDAKDDFHRNYYGCITAMDEQIGRLRAELEKLGIAENTLITFCSDNGPEGGNKSPGSAGDFRGRKRSLYEGGVRVPGLVEWPAKIKARTVTDFPASTSDYLPTILAAIGAELPDRRPTDGIDLLPALQRKVKKRDQNPIGFQSGKTASFVGHRYKLIGTKKKFELYDLLNDPHETTDLAKSKPDIVRNMTKQLDTWKASCKNSDQGKDYTAKKAAVRFGAIADCQYADADTKGKRHYRLAAKKLEEAVTELNTDTELDFVTIKQEQIDWLGARLEAARKEGQRAIIFCHYPLTPEAHHNLWNDTEMLEFLKGHNDIIAAWINGHNHAGGYEQRDGIHYLTMKGMLDTKDNAFATIEISDDKIEVNGHYREPDRSLDISKKP